MQVSFARMMVAGGLLVATIPAYAHHSAAVAYYIDKTVTVQGVISEVKWVNPHTWIFVETKDADGKTVKWGFEGKVPNLLIRSGITPSVLKPGLQVTISGHPARDESQKFGEVIEVTFADGKTIKP
jgi:Family of unknown function (DUF6152)